MRHYNPLVITLFALLFSCTPAEIQVESIVINETAISIEPGEKTTLIATVLPENATDKSIVWKTTNESVAVVSQTGVVEGISEGKSTITAMCGGKIAKCDVLVSIPVTEVRISKQSAKLPVGGKLQLKAQAFPENASDKRITWSTSNANVATVENGLVSALMIGDAIITASSGEASVSCSINVSTPFNYGGLCLESIDGGVIHIDNPLQLLIEYKIESYDWASFTDSFFNITVKPGERVWFRGHNATYAIPDDEYWYINTSFNTLVGTFYIYGNLMSLVYGDEYEDQTVLTGDNTFVSLFSENGNIINHPVLDIELPATTLTPSCYNSMFNSCTNLTRAPMLPAKKLEYECYRGMFGKCTSLKEVAEMKATEIGESSCAWMYYQSGIESVPELPATVIAERSYCSMFESCTNLKTGPTTLPASTIAKSCYRGMFKGCISLENAPELPATEIESADLCYYEMFSGCASLKTAPLLPSKTLSKLCYTGMFKDCSLLDVAPELPATSLAYSCYEEMFANCPLVVAPELPAQKLAENCYKKMFEGCKMLKKAPRLHALRLVDNCYSYMFRGCSKIDYIVALFLRKPSASYNSNWLDGVSSEGVFVKNSEATWDVWGEHGIPEGWTVEYEQIEVT